MNELSKQGIAPEKIRAARQEAEGMTYKAHYMIDNARAYRYEVAFAIADEKVRKAERASKTQSK